MIQKIIAKIEATSITDKMPKKITTMRKERTIAVVSGEGTIGIADKINEKTIPIQQNNIIPIII